MVPVEVDIRGIAAGGAGVGALPDGRAVFVHRTAPGERVGIRVTEERKRWARGAALRVVEPSAARRQPPCPLYDRCGGCTLQHLEYPAQLDAKRTVVRDALERIAGLSVDVPEVTPSPLELNYRNRVTFTLRRLRGGRVVAGFHELERPGRIVDVGGECLLPDEAIGRAWVSLRRSWGPGARLLPGGGQLRLTLRTVDAGVNLVIHGGSGPGDPETLHSAVEGLVAIWQVGNDGAAVRLAGDPAATESWMGRTFPAGPTAFLQVNPGAAAPLQEAVLEAVGPGAGRRVVDAYAGTGIYARRLAEAGATAVAIEVDSGAVRAARTHPTEGLTVLEGRVEERLGEALPADVVILNPPRTGLHERVPALLVEAKPPRIVYVSCDPATLARDAGRLGGGYGLTRVRTFDLFPQTAHVETVAIFERAPRGTGPESGYDAGPDDEPRHDPEDEDITA